MARYTLLVEDDRHGNLAPSTIEADSDVDARQLAIQALHESEHHQSVELWLGDAYLAKVERLDIDLGAAGSDARANDDAATRDD